MDGEPARYRREGDFLTITPKQAAFTLSVTYHGRPDYLDSLWNRSIYYMPNSCYFPECFAWYPQDWAHRQEIIFSLKVSPNNNLVTNLTDTIGPKHKLLVAQRKETSLYLATGNFEETHYKGIRVVAFPQYIRNLSLLTDKLDEALEAAPLGIPCLPINSPGLYEALPSPEDAVVIPEPSQIKTILYLPYSYFAVTPGYLFEDTWIQNEWNLS